MMETAKLALIAFMGVTMIFALIYIIQGIGKIVVQGEQPGTSTERGGCFIILFAAGAIVVILSILYAAFSN